MRRLALTRIMVAFALILMTLFENAAALSWLPASMRVPMGAINLLPENFSRDPVLWTLLDLFIPLALLLALVGYRARLSLLVGAGAYFVKTGLLRAHNYMYHPGLVPLQMAFLLLLTPCGDALSLDARWRRVRPKPEAVYRWALTLVWLPLVMAYLMAGLNKLTTGGLDWFAPDNLRGYVAGNQNRTPQYSVDMRGVINLVPDALWSLLALASVVIELSYISVIWSQRARWVLPLCAGAMHVGIWVVLGPQFPDLIVLQWAVFPTEQVWSYVTRRWSSWSSSPSPSSG